MITCIRDIRRQRDLSLEEVAARCVPPTTAQTVGRLETGTRTVTVAWLNRLAAALGVTAADLVRLPETADLPLLAELDAAGARAPRRAGSAPFIRPPAGAVAVAVRGSVGDYRAGDLLWCERLAPEAFARALNRDAVVPRAAGRFAFGRLLAVEDKRIALLPPLAGRQVVLAPPPWLAVATRLVRTL